MERENYYDAKEKYLKVLEEKLLSQINCSSCENGTLNGFQSFFDSDTFTEYANILGSTEDFEMTEDKIIINTVGDESYPEIMDELFEEYFGNEYSPGNWDCVENFRGYLTYEILLSK